MNLIEASESERRCAFHNVMGACDFQKMLPDQLFVGVWRAFLFFPSDFMFSPDFVDVVRELMRLEEALVACLLNLDKTEKLAFGGASLMLIDAAVDRAAYEKKLRAGGPATGWLFDVDRYACASDVGEWCIYSEKSNDVAVIALRKLSGREKFEVPLKHLSAKTIDDLVSDGCAPQFPFDRLVPAWRKGLVDHYGQEAWGGK